MKFIVTMVLAIPPASLLAESTDVLSGGGGWVGAGLLGFVLAWLLYKHLPAKDQQIKDLISAHLLVEKEQRDAHSKAEKDQRDAHIAMEEKQRTDFRATLEAVLKHSEKQIEGLGAALKLELQGIKTEVVRVRDVSAS